MKVVCRFPPSRTETLTHKLRLSNGHTCSAPPFGQVQSPTIDGSLSSFLATSFTCGCPPTSAQLTIESVPPSVAEGASVLLHVHNLPENLRTFSWYKGVIVFNHLEVARHIIATNSTMPGPAHSGRETVYSNGSLLLHNITWKDAGFYTLRTLSRDLKIELVHVQLHVDCK